MVFLPVKILDSRNDGPAAMAIETTNDQSTARAPAHLL